MASSLGARAARDNRVDGGYFRPVLVRLVFMRWPRGAAVAFCALLGVLLPALHGMSGMHEREPSVHDEFSYLLAADTFAHGRLSNPAPPLPEFFEAPHILVTPTYTSKYPPGQALALALGERVGGHPLWGVWLSCGLFASSLCWMLQAWTRREWALATAVVAIVTLGITGYWPQSYWGGMLAAAAGALVFGAMRRTCRSPRIASSIVMGLGVVLLANTRMYEGALACVPAAVVLGRWLVRDRRTPLRSKITSWLAPFAAVLLLGAAWMVTYDHAVTGEWLSTPYARHQAEYYPQSVFVFSPMRAPEREPLARLATYYRDEYRAAAPANEGGVQLVAHVVRNLLERFPATIESALGIGDYLPGSEPYRDLLLWVVVFLVVTLRDGWALFCGLAVLFVVVGASLSWWWAPHYTAPVVPLVLAMAAMALQRIASRFRPSDWRRTVAAPAVVFSTAVYLVVPVAVHRLAPPPAPAVMPGDAAPHRPSYRTRADLMHRLEAQGGKHLVFVAYDPRFSVQDGEWVYNPADLDGASVLFAHDLGAAKNPQLIAAYPGRSVWTVTVSPQEAVLRPYQR